MSGGVKLTFVHQYSGDPPKRRRLAKACDTCRARKKRCKHYQAADGEDDGGQDSSWDANDDSTSSRHQLDNDDEVQENTPPPSATRRAYFISDMIPASALVNRPAPPTSTPATEPQPPSDKVGVWVDRREWEALIEQKNASDAANANQTVDKATGHENGFRNNYARPHSASLAALIDIYFARIHPILPLLDEAEFRSNHVGGQVPEPLVHAMVLVAAKDSQAAPHLRLSDSPISTSLVSTRHFCTVLHTSVTGALKTPVRFDKVTLIRILALSSLHCEGPEGAEEASMRLSQAMHHAQTLGIHLGQRATFQAGNEAAMKRLFWSLYALDRSQAATNGRPIIMSDIDIAIDAFHPAGASGFPAFEAWLRITSILNTIIDFYRPSRSSASTGWEASPYPGLEEILDDTHAWTQPASVLATIHLFYLSVAMLSHRTRAVREMPRGLTSHVRQRLCALEVIRLLDSAVPEPGAPPPLPHQQETPPTPQRPAAAAAATVSIHPLPVVPYAISLALSVAYQHLRHSQLEHQQADALRDFRACCRILQVLRRTWCSADVMATLARKVLDELDRAKDLAIFRVKRARRDGGAEGGGGGGGKGHAGFGGGGGGMETGSDAGAADQGDKELIPPPTACHNGVGRTPVLFGRGSRGVGGEKAGAGEDGLVEGGDPSVVDGGEDGAAQAVMGPAATPAPPQDGLSIFDNIDDVFGAFMDVNYSLNIEDMSFVDELAPLNWQYEADDAAAAAGMELLNDEG